jgi:hypothetical protein
MKVLYSNAIYCSQALNKYALTARDMVHKYGKNQQRASVYEEAKANFAKLR